MSSGTVRSAWLLLLCGYPLKVLLGKMAVGWEAYGAGQLQYRGDVERAEFLCSLPENKKHFWTNDCLQAQREARRWPVVRAAERVIQELHSCGDFHCSDIFLYVANSWAGTLVLAAVCLFVLWVATRSLENVPLTGGPSAIWRRMIKRAPVFSTKTPPPRSPPAYADSVLYTGEEEEDMMNDDDKGIIGDYANNKQKQRRRMRLDGSDELVSKTGGGGGAPFDFFDSVPAPTTAPPPSPAFVEVPAMQRKVANILSDWMRQATDSKKVS
jgi:hypothetical protein